MKKSVFLLLALLILSCIPYSTAPEIEGTRLLQARHFKGDLPDVYAVVFENPYGSNEFNLFLRNRLHVQGEGIPSEIPFVLNGHRYFLSVHECMRYNRYVNLFSGIVDDLIWGSDDDADFEYAELLIDEDNALFDDQEKGYAYIALTVKDKYGRDALSEGHIEQRLVVNYLRLLHYDYTNPTMELLWQKDTLNQSDFRKPLSLSDKF